MHEESFRTAQRNVNNDNEYKSARAKLLNREGGEDANERIYPEMEQLDPRNIGEKTSQVHNVVPSNTEIESMIASQVSRTTDQVVAREIATIVVDSLDNTLQYVCNKVCTKARSVVSNVLPQNLWYLLRQEVMDKIPNK